MITVNGGLTTLYGVYSATVIIHIVGLLLIGGVILLRREKPFRKGLPWYLYIGGVIGVASTVFTNYAFGKISVSAILALSLFGSSVMGLLVDQFGLFQCACTASARTQLPGLMLVLGGIVCLMIGSFSLLPVLAVFASGILLVVSRSFNSRLADQTACTRAHSSTTSAGFAPPSPCFFYWSRRAGCGEVCVFARLVDLPRRRDRSCNGVSHQRRGGQNSRAVYFASNVRRPGVHGRSAGRAARRSILAANLIGGVFVALGMTLNLLLERRDHAKPPLSTESRNRKHKAASEIRCGFFMRGFQRATAPWPGVGDGVPVKAISVSPHG
jgi:uncharacterized membrane protein YdcZ (DUF606 family)